MKYLVDRALQIFAMPGSKSSICSISGNTGSNQQDQDLMMFRQILDQ